MTPDLGLRWAAVPKQRLDEQVPEQRRRGANLSSAQLGTTMFLWSSDSDDSDVDDTLRPLGIRTQAARQPWHVTQVGTAFLDEAPPDVRVLLDRGRHLVVDGLTPDLASGSSTCWRAEPLEPGAVIVEPVALPAGRADPQVDQLLAGLDTTRFTADIGTLVGFGTRHSLSAGFTQAADWATARLTTLGYAVSRAPITVGSGHSEYVVGDRAGTAATRGLVVVTAHLDSINIAGGPAAPAPGADDNGSGSAGVLELARLLATVPWQHDLRMILFGGEEEGLFGSQQYVAGLPAADRDRVRAVLNMDMVATRSTVSQGVLLEGAPVSSAQISALASAAATYTSLSVQTSLSPFASDHVPFIDAGMPAVLTIEANDSANHNIHSDRDVMAHVEPGLMLQILRMNLAALAGWLGRSAVRPNPAGPVVSRAPGLIDVFVIGTDHAVYQKAWNGSAWQPSVTGYETLGSP